MLAYPINDTLPFICKGGICSVSDSVLYLGAELDRAVNRMDFFRLFKSLALNYEYQSFLLSCLVEDNRGINLQHEHSIYSLDHGHSMLWGSGGEAAMIPVTDSIVAQFKRSTIPFFADTTQQSSDLIEAFGCDTVTVIPLHTFNAKRYCLMLFGEREQPPRETLALIAFDAATVFQRYDEAIISLDSINGLSDREIEIVRWTSEGKTSTEIAIILGLSSHTVNTYITTGMRKLGVVNRAQMVASALRRGLIS
jgi:DNA-binding CsgD family transcriptional regulator